MINLITFNSATAKALRDYDPSIQCSYLGTVQRQNNDEYWTSVNSYLANGVGLASQLSTIGAEALQESNARGEMYWLWTFDTGNYNQLITLISNGNRAFTINYMNFFTKNQYKLISENNITLADNESKTIEIKAVSYDKTISTADNAEIIVLSNNATVNGNTITRTGSGDIYVVYKMLAHWTLYQSPLNFYIYSDMMIIR